MIVSTENLILVTHLFPDISLMHIHFYQQTIPKLELSILNYDFQLNYLHGSPIKTSRFDGIRRETGSADSSTSSHNVKMTQTFKNKTFMTEREDGCAIALGL
jgi:hypothetical protein